MDSTKCIVALHDVAARLSWRRLAGFIVTVFTLFTLLTAAPLSTAATPSANGSRGQMVVDGSGATWTFDATHTLRDGVWVGGGAGVEYLYVNLGVYVVISGGGVYKWSDGWSYAGNDAAAILAQASSPPANNSPAANNTLREVVTTGSISANSKQLNVASATGFSVGDWVIVEIGKEAGQGQRGTRGVGGTWPSKSYPTEAQLLADRSQPNRQFAWAEDSGYAYWWLDGVWYDLAPNRPNTFYTGQYYIGKAVPRSLQARITAINGNTLTLDQSAAANASDANVYLDNAPIINNLVASGAALSLPAGRFATGGVLWIQNKGGFTLSGQGKDQTTIYSPKGVPSAQIQAYQAPNTTVRDLTLQGNFRDQGFGLNWTGSTPAGTNQPVTDYDVPQGAAFPRGVLFWVGSHNGVAQDLRVIDVAQQAVGVSYADNVWGRRIENIQNDLMRQYVQWQFQWADANGGGCEDCEVRSTYVIPGFEAFKSSNVQFIRPKGMNAMMAMNGSGGWLIQDGEFRFTENSLHPESDRVEASPWHSVINVNTNIGVTPQVALGGTIRNVTMIQAGYLNANNDSIKGITVNDKNPDIRIEGVAYYAPDFKAPTVSNGPLGLTSTGPNTTINGMLVIGKPGPWANIGNNYGWGQNCTAQFVYGCAEGTYTSAAMNAFLANGTAGWVTTDSGGSSSGGSGSTGGGSSGGGTGSGGSTSGGGTDTGSSGSTTPATPSANGTRGTQVVDATGAVWTFEDARTMRNGVWVGGGSAQEYLYVNSTVYAITASGMYKWNDGWSFAVSPDGTRGTQIVEASGAVWTFDGTHTLRNGVWVGGGNAQEYLYLNSTVYAITGSGIYKWNDGWSFAGTDVAAIGGGSTGGSDTGSGSGGGSNTGGGSTGGSDTGSGSGGGSNTGGGNTGGSDTGSGSGGGSNTGGGNTGGSDTGGQNGDSSAKLRTVASDFSGKRTSAVLWRNTKTGANAIWTVDKGAVTMTSSIQAAETTWQAAGIGDFDGDGKADILWRDNSGNVFVWVMNNTNVARTGAVASVPTSWKVAGTGDFDGDGKADVLWRAKDGTVAVWLMDGLTIKSTTALFKVATTWSVGGIGDLNNDGKADIVWLNTDGTVTTWLMNGPTDIHMSVAGNVTVGWSVAAVADYNGDGKADVLWRNGSSGENAIWFMDASIPTSAVFITGVPDTSWNVAAAGDYDGDGKADILWRHSKTGDNLIWLMDGGTSKSATQIPTLKGTNWTVVEP